MISIINKKQTTLLTQQTLLEYSLHIGNTKNYRNNRNSDFIIISPQNIDLINQIYTLLFFRKFITTITTLIEYHGQILTILPETTLKLQNIKQHTFAYN